METYNIKDYFIRQYDIKGTIEPVETSIDKIIYKYNLEYPLSIRRISEIKNEYSFEYMIIENSEISIVYGMKLILFSCTKDFVDIYLKYTNLDLSKYGDTENIKSMFIVIDDKLFRISKVIIKDMYTYKFYKVKDLNESDIKFIKDNNNRLIDIDKNFVDKIL